MSTTRQGDGRAKRTGEDVDENEVSGVTRLLILANVSERELLDTRVASSRLGSVDGEEDNPGNSHAAGKVEGEFPSVEEETGKATHKGRKISIIKYRKRTKT